VVKLEEVTDAMIWGQASIHRELDSVQNLATVPLLTDSLTGVLFKRTSLETIQELDEHSISYDDDHSTRDPLESRICSGMDENKQIYTVGNSLEDASRNNSIASIDSDVTDPTSESVTDETEWNDSDSEVESEYVNDSVSVFPPTDIATYDSGNGNSENEVIMPEDEVEIYNNMIDIDDTPPANLVDNHENPPHNRSVAILQTSPDNEITKILDSIITRAESLMIVKSALAEVLSGVDGQIQRDVPLSSSHLVESTLWQQPRARDDSHNATSTKIPSDLVPNVAPIADSVSEARLQPSDSKLTESFVDDANKKGITLGTDALDSVAIRLEGYTIAEDIISELLSAFDNQIQESVESQIAGFDESNEFEEPLVIQAPIKMEQTCTTQQVEAVETTHGFEALSARDLEYYASAADYKTVSELVDTIISRAESVVFVRSILNDLVQTIPPSVEFSMPPTAPGDLESTRQNFDSNLHKQDLVATQVFDTLTLSDTFTSDHATESFIEDTDRMALVAHPEKVDSVDESVIQDLENDLVELESLVSIALTHIEQQVVPQSASTPDLSQEEETRSAATETDNEAEDIATADLTSQPPVDRSDVLESIITPAENYLMSKSIILDLLDEISLDKIDQESQIPVESDQSAELETVEILPALTEITNERVHADNSQRDAIHSTIAFAEPVSQSANVEIAGILDMIVKRAEGHMLANKIMMDVLQLVEVEIEQKARSMSPVSQDNFPFNEDIDQREVSEESVGILIAPSESDTFETESERNLSRPSEISTPIDLTDFLDTILTRTDGYITVKEIMNDVLSASEAEIEQYEHAQTISIGNITKLQQFITSNVEGCGERFTTESAIINEAQHQVQDSLKLPDEHGHQSVRTDQIRNVVDMILNRAESYVIVRSLLRDLIQNVPLQNIEEISLEPTRPIEAQHIFDLEDCSDLKEGLTDIQLQEFTEFASNRVHEVVGGNVSSSTADAEPHMIATCIITDIISSMPFNRLDDDEQNRAFLSGTSREKNTDTVDILPKQNVSEASSSSLKDIEQPNESSDESLSAKVNSVNDSDGLHADLDNNIPLHISSTELIGDDISDEVESVLSSSEYRTDDQGRSTIQKLDEYVTSDFEFSSVQDIEFEDIADMETSTYDLNARWSLQRDSALDLTEQKSMDKSAAQVTSLSLDVKSIALPDMMKPEVIAIPADGDDNKEAVIDRVSHYQCYKKISVI
jgi:hypothetical protein